MKMPPTRFEPEQLVYLRANVDIAGVVTGFVVRKDCPPQALVIWGDDPTQESAHWESELLAEKPADWERKNE